VGSKRERQYSQKVVLFECRIVLSNLAKRFRKNDAARHNNAAGLFQKTSSGF
jgi:hypothetical protein